MPAEIVEIGEMLRYRFEDFRWSGAMVCSIPELEVRSLGPLVGGK